MIPSTRFLCTALGCSLFLTSAHAIDDVAPIDPKPILEALKTIKEQQSSVIKANKQRFIQEALNAASSSARAVELWEEAVRATQFQGVAKENAQFRDWKEKEGDTLKDKEVQVALHLYFNWLALTLQRSAGVEVKALFPAVLNHAHEVMADQVAMESFDDVVKKDDKPVVGPGKPKAASAREKEKKQDIAATKKMHDQILKQPLAGSAFVQWMRLSDYITDVAPTPRRNAGGGGPGGGRGRTVDTVTRAELPKPDDASPTTWEGIPGNYDGMFMNILLPEMRANRDARVVEYWDNKLKREADRATKDKLTFDIDKFNQVRRPQILWNRDQDLVRIGQKNRAVNDMFTQIKTFPTHPDAPAWIVELETLLLPPAPLPPTAAVSAPDAATPPGAATAATALPGSQ